jgi:Tol biopolymer transport system component
VILNLHKGVVEAATRQLIALCSMVVIGAGSTPTFAQTSPPGTDIYIAPLSNESGAIVAGRPVNITARPGYDNQPFFSFDETFILFTAADTRGITDIHRYEIKTGKTTRVTNTPESEYSPTVMKGGNRFSTVRVEADGTQRLWQFDMDGTNPRLVLAAVDSVGYHTWVDDNTLGLFVLGDPHTLRIADRRQDADRVVASDIGRCLGTIPGTRQISFVQIIDEGESWITGYDVESGESHRLVQTLPDSEDYAWTPDGDLLMAGGSVLFLWAGDGAWRQFADLSQRGPVNITRLAIGASGRWLALVADDS